MAPTTNKNERKTNATNRL